MEADNEKSIQSLMMEISRMYMEKCFMKLKKLGIHPRQIPILAVLYKEDWCSQKELAAKLGAKPPTVTVSIQRLEKSGLLIRKQDEKDQRVSRIYLTEKGKQAKERGMKRVEENEKILLDGFSDAELCLLRRFLEQITSNIDKIPGSSGKNDTKKVRQQK